MNVQQVLLQAKSILSPQSMSPELWSVLEASLPAATRLAEIEVINSDSTLKRALLANFSVTLTNGSADLTPLLSQSEPLYYKLPFVAVQDSASNNQIYWTNDKTTLDLLASGSLYYYTTVGSSLYVVPTSLTSVKITGFKLLSAQNAPEAIAPFVLTKLIDLVKPSFAPQLDVADDKADRGV